MTASPERIVLTGGAGFIGSHVAEGLLRTSRTVVIIDNLSDFYSPQRKKQNLKEIASTGEFTFHEADICNSEEMTRIFETAQPDAVVHLAARAGVRPSIEEPVAYEEVNIAGTVKLLELCRNFRVPRFVFGSSSSVYGASTQVPFSEGQHDLRPISPYAATKLAGELLCYTYAHLFGIQTICLRFFTVYGPRQRPDLAIHLFTRLIETGRPLPFFGDGSTGRDYTYVDDIVSGVLAALDYTSSSTPPFEIFNLGNCSPVKLDELVRSLEAVTGRKAARDIRPVPPGDVPLTWADISRAQQRLNFQPRTQLADGLKRFVQWYRAQSQPESKP